MFAFPRIQPLTEDLITQTVERAGGRRAHDDHDRRDMINADYRLGDSVIELKQLEDEGLSKPTRQQKIAGLFGSIQEGRPVVVIDPSLLSKDGRLKYASIMREPIKNALKKASKQMQQSREEDASIKRSVLLVVNIGFTALSHEELLDHVENRARQDSSHIDAVVVAGAYLYGDGLDAYALWPMDYVQINPDNPFVEFDALKAAWNGLAEEHMTAFVRGEHGLNATREAQRDVVFDLDGKTYVKPATPIGGEASFYPQGRPRLNESALGNVGTLALTYPVISQEEYRRIEKGASDDRPFLSLEDMEAEMRIAQAKSKPLLPTVGIQVTRAGVEAWRRRNPCPLDYEAVARYANDRFHRLMRGTLEKARKQPNTVRFPRKSIVVITEVIGQDAANDISHIAILRREQGGYLPTELVVNARIPFDHALGLGAVYAVQQEVRDMFWRKEMRHAWY